MKLLHILVISTLLLCSFFVGGCAEPFLTGFATGASTMIVVADETNKKFTEAQADANEAITQMEGMTNLAKEVVANADPNQLQLIATLTNADPVVVEQTVFDFIEAYNKAHGTVATIKEEADDPRTWMALALALVAAYQKVQRVRKK